MERGYLIEGGKGMRWDKSKRNIEKTPSIEDTIVGFNPSGNRLHAHRCKECQVIVFEY
jgi:hypothetical protein